MVHCRNDGHVTLWTAGPGTCTGILKRRKYFSLYMASAAAVSYPDEMETFLKKLQFPSDELLKGSLKILVKEAVTVPQLRSLTKDECEEIGLAEQATVVILKVNENAPRVFMFLFIMPSALV
jgi:hypothetical protein